VKVWIADEEGRDFLGPMPPGVTVETGDDVAEPERVAFWSPPTPPDLRMLDQLTGVEVIQLRSAGADAWIGRVRPDVTLCDGRGIHDSSVAEWVVGAIIAYLRDFPFYARMQAERRWVAGSSNELAGKRALIVGAGSIGAAVEACLAPFDVTITRVARTPRPGVQGVADLASLLPAADIVIVLVPLTSATRGLVNAEFLAALPDGALLVNAARGAVVDAGALLAEASSGRIGAALDVTDPEPLPATSPLWTLPNVLLTPHIGGWVPGYPRRAYAFVGDQIRRYAAGEPLRNVVKDGY
jgi:phosphoglycerate dehydrogenase-like enzyme